MALRVNKMAPNVKNSHGTYFLNTLILHHLIAIQY